MATADRTARNQITLSSVLGMAQGCALVAEVLLTPVSAWRWHYGPPMPSRDTDAVHGGGAADTATGGVVPPVHLATTFARDDNYELTGSYSYSRTDNPAWKPVEDLAARLDGGAGAKVFASGLAAFACLCETLSSDAHVVAPQVMYHGAQEWLRRLQTRRGIGLTLFDPADPAGLQTAVSPGETEMVWIETPINPTWELVDIAAAARTAHEAGAILGVDVTTAPLTTRPIEHGADIIFHSATKFYNGHSDVCAGLLITAEENDRWADVHEVRTLSGGILGPHEAWLLLRGMRTMPLRIDRASASALAIAEFLDGHPAVHTTRYPGLPSHPGHEIALKQMDRGFGAMLSFQVVGGADAARHVAQAAQVCVRATSLGGVESLIEHRIVSEGPNTIIPDDLIRLSVGIEPVDELIADLEQALARAGP